MQFNKQELISLIAVLNDQLNSIEESVDTFEAQVENKADAIVEAKLEKLRRIEKLNAAFFIAMEPELGSELAEFIVYDCLNKGRLSSDYRTMLKAYPKIGDNIHHRRMLYVVSALYRLQFATDKAIISQLKSTIKYNSACDHCGLIARKVQDYINNNL